MPSSNRPIRVLVVDDSRSQRELLVGMLRASDTFLVAGTAGDGEGAVNATLTLRPDVIAMDIHLPGIDGYEATRQIMQRCPTPIVMISSSNGDSERRSIQALAAGALTVVRKPLSLGRGVDEQDRVNFLTMLRLMAGVRVVTRFPSRGPADHDEQPAVSARETEKEPVLRRTPAPGSPQLLAIAASTGGPAAMQAVLNGLGRAYPLPVLVVQHIARGFVAALVDWLRSTTPMPIHIAAHDERLLPGHAYLAPDDHHLLVVSRGTVGLRRCTPADRYCPSADMLFTSVADSYGARAIGVIMTGMGDDGASGLHRLRRAGAPTLAQDEASCVVFGMPHAAIMAGAVMQVEALTNLAPTVLALTGGSARACAG